MAALVYFVQPIDYATLTERHVLVSCPFAVSLTLLPVTITTNDCHGNSGA